MTEEKYAYNNTEQEKFAKEVEITIFDPRGIPVDKYKQAYPELNRIIEFQNLTPKQLRFVWWYSNPTSPLVLNESIAFKRATRAYYKVWGDAVNDQKNRDALCSLRFADNLRVAVEKMATFDVSTRHKANLIADKIFSDCEKIANLTPEDFGEITESGSYNNIDYVKFLSTKSLALKMLPELLKTKEEGFSVKEKTKSIKEEDDGQANISQFLTSKKDDNE